MSNSSTKKEKTLSEILKEKEQKMIRSFTPNNTFYDFQIIDAVTQLLKIERKELEKYAKFVEKHKTKDSPDWLVAQARIREVDELLKRVK